MDSPKKNTVRDAWRIAKSYWISEEKRSAWNNAFYNALQKFDGGEFFRQLALFGVLASLYIVMVVYALYLNQMLQIRWRRWLTRRYLTN